MNQRKKGQANEYISANIDIQRKNQAITRHASGSCGNSCTGEELYCMQD